MSLNGSVRAIILRKLELYEKRVDHLYRDTVGVCTVGVGHAVLGRNRISEIPLITKKGNKPATTEQKLAEYDFVMSQPKGLRADRYEFNLIISDIDIDTLMDADLADFYSSLRKTYSKSKGYKANFDDFPPDAQIALFDMIFNLGATKLKSKFPKMNDYIREEKWDKAADESNRPQVQTPRNVFVRTRFRSAEQN